MPPIPPRDAIVIVLDVGKSVSSLRYWEDKTFFELSKDCVSRIIQRKLISESKDALSIILIGSEESDNPLGVSGYKNICCKFDFQLSSWDMLDFIEKEVKTTDVDSDWVGGLIVSMEMLKVFEEYNNVQNKTIVIFSDFAHPASDDIKIISKSVKSLGITITVIGPDSISFLPECENEPMVKKRKVDNDDRPGEKLVYQLWQELSDEMIICNFESALKQLCSYVRKSRRVMPWNCILDIGDVKINISMFKKTDPKQPRKYDTKCLKPAGGDSDAGPSVQSSIIKDKVMHYKHETGDGNEFLDVEVKPEDTVEGYLYGTTIIPFSEEDKTALNFKSGPKAFSVIGFTKITSVPYYLLSGDCSYVVLARDNDQNAEVALSAIIQGMKKMECLAIVRKVHMNNSRLALGILYPVIEEIEEGDEVSHKEFLLFVELAFEEEVKSIKFPSLERIAENITEKQLEAVDELIDGMNLMNADKGLNGEPCEAFQLSRLHDLKEQFYNYCVIQRGLRPDKPLPTSLPPYIEEFVKVPALVEERRTSLIKGIKEQFKVELRKTTEVEKEKNQENKTTEANEKTRHGVEHFTESVIREEEDPMKRDWMNLFGKEFPTDSELDHFFSKYLEMGEAEKSDMLKSFEDVIREVRRLYLKVNPDAFNWWMRRFKSYTREDSGMGLEAWSVLVSENIGLISEKENEYSSVSEEEAEEFLCEDVTKSMPCRTPKDKEPDFAPCNEVLDDLQAEQMAVDSFF